MGGHVLKKIERRMDMSKGNICTEKDMCWHSLRIFFRNWRKAMVENGGAVVVKQEPAMVAMKKDEGNKKKKAQLSSHLKCDRF